MTRLALIPLLALVACQAAPEANAANDAVAANQAEAPVKDVETLPPDETTITEPAEDAAGGGGRLPARTIPAAFHGRWGMVPADCDPGRDDAKGLVEIRADSMKFYESRAQLTRLVGSSPEKVEAEFAFTGEGQNWTKTETLAISDDSHTLIRTEDGGESRYKRCPA